MSLFRRVLVLLLVPVLAVGAGCASAPQPRNDEAERRVAQLEDEVRSLRQMHEEEVAGLRESLGQARDAAEQERRELGRLEQQLGAARASTDAIEASRDAALALLRQREEELARLRRERDGLPSTAEEAVALLLDKDRELKALRAELVRLRAGEAEAPNPALDGAVTLAHLDLEVPVARIDGEPLSRRDFVEYLYRDLGAPKLLDLFLNRYLVLREGKHRGLEISDVDVAMWVSQQVLQHAEQAGSPEQLDEQLAGQGFTREAWEARLSYQAKPILILQRLVEDERETPEGRKAFEDRLWDAYRETYSERVRARHIVIGVPAQASRFDEEAAQAKMKQIRLELERGIPFDKVAQRHSQDRESAKLGGSLGTFDRARFAELPRLNTALFTLEPGSPSPPVRSAVGYHIIEVEQRLPPERPFDEQVRRELLERLKTEPPAEAEVTLVLRRIRARSRIETALIFDPRK